MRYPTSLVPLLLLLAGCGGGSGGGSGSSALSGTLKLSATDAPFDHSMVAEAVVMVSKVRLHRDAAASSGFVTFYDGPPVELPLDRLNNGIKNLISSGRLEEGTYRQIRLHLTGGRLKLKNGNEYTTDDGSLSLPGSTTSSGYKVFLDPGVEIVAGVEEEVLLDFDLVKTFQPVPANDPENARSYKLHPNVRASVMSESGEMRPTVDRKDSVGRVTSAPEAVLYVLMPGEADLSKSIASTVADDEGSGAILGLSPGQYDVVATLDGETGRTDGVTVNRKGVSSFSVMIEP